MPENEKANLTAGAEALGNPAEKSQRPSNEMFRKSIAPKVENSPPKLASKAAKKIYLERVKKNGNSWFLAVPVLFAVALGIDFSVGEPFETPAPGSAGDTLTREDRRMAYLVYNLMDSNGIVIGADLVRGEQLFMRNCRPCHGDDGRRMNLSGDMRNPRYIGSTAHDELPTFWFMMNFGDSVRGMLPYYDEIPLDEMIDIAGFAQTLPQHAWSAEEAAAARREDSIMTENRRKSGLQE